jgi:hypothetical protein
MPSYGLTDSYIYVCCCLLCLCLEMKIKREHVKGSDTGETKPEVELVTEDMVNRMENPGQVEVCKSSSSKKNE